MTYERLRKQATGNYTFESSYRDDDGVHHNVTAPVSLTIKDGGGLTLYTGTPTLHAGALSITLPVATLPKLDVYSFTWTGQHESATVTWVDEVEIVGGYLFEIADLRNADRAFADANKYPTDTLKQIRIWVEDLIQGERAADVAFVPRGRRVVTQGSGEYDRSTGAFGLFVPNYEVTSVYSATVDGTALTNAQVSAIVCDDDTLWSKDTTWPAGNKNISLHYVHGYERTPGAITRAAILLAREYLVKSDLPSRASATSIGDQIFRLTIAGRDGITGLPDVDSAIEQFGRKGFKVG